MCIHGVKSLASPVFLLKQFLNYHDDILLYMENLYRLWICINN